jgi:hypothetical protein
VDCSVAAAAAAHAGETEVGVSDGNTWWKDTTTPTWQQMKLKAYAASGARVYGPYRSIADLVTNNSEARAYLPRAIMMCRHPERRAVLIGLMMEVL